MSESPQPPANGAVAPSGKMPMKIPIAPGKIQVKLSLQSLAIKLPPKPAAAGFQSLLPSRPAAPVAAVKPKPSRKEDDDDDIAALGIAKKPVAAVAAPPKKIAAPVAVKAVAPRPAAAPRPAVVRPAKRQRTPSPARSESSEEEVDEESQSLFARASQKGLVPINDASLLEAEDEPVVPGIPPRPPIQKQFPSDLGAAIDRLQKRIQGEEVKARIRDDNKTISLSTSKVNYIDPRIVCSWCRKNSFPISRVFSATLQKKFPWAMQAPDNYEF